MDLKTIIDLISKSNINNEKVYELVKEASTLDLKKYVVGSSTGVKAGIKINSRVKDIQKATLKMFDKVAENSSRLGDFGFKASVEHAQNKVDFILEIDNKAINVSSKAYQLKNTTYKNRRGQEVAAQIKLVSGTPLTSILFGAERLRSRAGTHFLNALVEHPDGKVTNRENAIQALKLMVIYSGLSGDLTIKNQKIADVLMIEDTSSKNGYTHFFSIEDIMQDCIQSLQINKKYFDIYPNLDSLYLKNEYVVGQKGTIRPAAQRIAKVLSLAHQTKISAGLLVGDYINQKVATKGELI